MKNDIKKLSILFISETLIYEVSVEGISVKNQINTVGQGTWLQRILSTGHNLAKITVLQK